MGYRTAGLDQLRIMRGISVHCKFDTITYDTRVQS